MLVPAGLLLEIRGFCLPIFCPTPCFRTAGASADIFFRLHREKTAQRVACHGENENPEATQRDINVCRSIMDA